MGVGVGEGVGVGWWVGCGAEEGARIYQVSIHCMPLYCIVVLSLPQTQSIGQSNYTDCDQSF